MGSSKYTSKSFRAFGADSMSESELALSQKVTPYQVADWSKENRPTYSEIKETFVKNLNKKDQRFFLSELVAGQLSVEEEEQRRFDLKLKEELALAVTAIKSEAYSDGYNKGLEKGVEKAFDEEKARIAARLESLALATNDLLTSKRDLESDYERKITEYAFQIAEIIVESEIKNRPESVGLVVKNVLDLLSKEEDVKIYLGLKNKAHITYLNDEIGKINRKGSISIEVRDDLVPGDVVVESISGEVSARVHERVEAFRQELLNHLEQSEIEAETKKAV